MTPEPLRILLVADDPEQIRRIGQGLQRQGSGRVVLEGADSLATARRRIAAGEYDLAVLDLALGEEPGLGLLLDFRAVAPDVPVVALGRPDAEDDLAASLAAGAADCLGADALDCAGLLDRLSCAAARTRVDAAETRRHRRTAAAVEAAGDLVWYWKPGGPVWLKAPDPAAWGLPGDRATEELEALRERVHPDDRERATKAIADALEGEGAWRIEGRVRLGGGGYRWCECRGRVRRDASGVLECVAGVVADVQRQHNALRELERGRRSLRAMMDSDPVPMAIVNASGFVTDCNRAWLEFEEEDCYAGTRFGPGMAFLPDGEHDDRAVPGLSAEELARGLKQVLGGVVAQFTCEYGAAGRRWRIRIFPLLNPGIAGAVIRHEDLTEESESAARVAGKLDAAELSLAGVPGPYFRLDPEFRVQEANDGALALCARPPEGRDILKALPRADADAVSAALAAAGASDGAAWEDALPRDGGAARRWGALAVRHDDRVAGFGLFAVDIADIMVEDSVLEAARDAAEASPVGIALVAGAGTEATIQWANAAFAALSGNPADGLPGRRLADHLAGAGRWDADGLARAMADPTSAARLTVHRYDGAAWELAFAYAGRFTCIAAADVADRERSVTALTELRRRLQGALLGSGDGAWEWGEAAGSGWLSSRALEILGLPEDASQDTFEAAIDRVHRADRARLREALRKAASNGEQFQEEFRLLDASPTWVEIRGAQGRSGGPVAGTLRDVTEAHGVREALEDRERRAVLAIRGAQVGTWSWSSRSNTLRVDGQARRLHGAGSEAGRVSLRAWLKRIVPGDRRRVLEALAQPAEDGRVYLEYRVAGDNRVVVVEGHLLGGDGQARRRADGVCRDVTAQVRERAAERRVGEIATATLDALPGLAARVRPDGTLEWSNPGWQQAFPGAGSLSEAFGSERYAELEPRLKAVFTGDALHSPLVLSISGQARQVDGFWVPVAETGDLLVVLHDLTDRWEADNRLAQVRRMEAVGRLAGGAAHEFNNLLGVIIGSLELLEAEIGEQAPVARRVGAALGSARQGAEVSARLLAFARQQDLEPEVLDASAFVRARSDLFGRLLGDGCVLELSLEGTPWPVEADPAQLETALVHLVDNACRAMPGGGRVRVSTANIELDADSARERLGSSGSAGTYLEIAVEDTGDGIPEELLGRVFDPFFTTRPPGSAAGLGLAVVWGFAQQSGGRACITSREGAGTRVALLLPQSRERAESGAAAESAVAEPVAPRHSVVLVEPDPALRETASDMLDSLGWQVRATGSAREALEALAEAPADVLLTELTPGGGMDGTSLARDAVARVPGLGVVFCASRGQPVGGPGHPVITKPYGRRELAAALRDAIQGERTHG